MTYRISIYTDNKITGLSFLKIVGISNTGSQQIKFMLLTDNCKETEIKSEMTEDEFELLTNYQKFDEHKDFYISEGGLQKMIAAF